METNCTPYSKTQRFFGELACRNCFYVDDNPDTSEGDTSARDCRLQVNSDLANMTVE